MDLSPGWHEIGLSSEGSSIATEKVFVVDPELRFGIVSDIDDTVMVTALPRPLLAAWHTFVVNEHARATTPGMPVLYERLTSQHAGAPVIYLSTGAWNVAPSLTRFLSRNLYPAGALLLTDWGPTADAWFRSGQLHKRNSLERLAREFPQIKWLLIGDDGQHDPVDLRRLRCASTPTTWRRSASVSCARARRCWPAAACGSGPRRMVTDVPWLYAPDGAALADKLERDRLPQRGWQSAAAARSQGLRSALGRPTLVLVTGPAGSGKTTLAYAIGAALGCPVVSRDAIKEGMAAAEPDFVPAPATR